MLTYMLKIKQKRENEISKKPNISFINNIQSVCIYSFFICLSI